VGARVEGDPAAVVVHDGGGVCGHPVPFRPARGGGAAPQGGRWENVGPRRATGEDALTPALRRRTLPTRALDRRGGRRATGRWGRCVAAVEAERARRSGGVTEDDEPASTLGRRRKHGCARCRPQERGRSSRWEAEYEAPVSGSGRMGKLQCRWLARRTEEEAMVEGTGRG
jgi:hypothetical protein